VHLAQKTVTSGGRLTVRLRTSPHAKVSLLLQVTAVRFVTKGKGKHRKRTRRTVVLYRLILHGVADKHGQFTGSLHVTYKLSKATTATLTVTVRIGRNTTTRNTRVVVRPRRLKPKHKR
jgi:hypothetical protein